MRVSKLSACSSKTNLLSRWLPNIKDTNKRQRQQMLKACTISRWGRICSQSGKATEDEKPLAGSSSNGSCVTENETFHYIHRPLNQGIKIPKTLSRIVTFTIISWIKSNSEKRSWIILDSTHSPGWRSCFSWEPLSHNLWCLIITI